MAPLVRGAAARIEQLTFRCGATKASLSGVIIGPMDRRRAACNRAICATDADPFQRICRHFLHNCIWHLESATKIGPRAGAILRKRCTKVCFLV